MILFQYKQMFINYTYLVELESKKEKTIWERVNHWCSTPSLVQTLLGYKEPDTALV